MTEQKVHGGGGEGVQGVPSLFLPIPAVPQLPGSMQAVLVGNPQNPGSQWALIGQQGQSLVPFLSPNPDLLHNIAGVSGAMLNPKLLDPRNDGSQVPSSEGFDLVDRNQLLSDLQLPRVVLPLGLEADAAAAAAVAGGGVCRPDVQDGLGFGGFGTSLGASFLDPEMDKKMRNAGMPGRLNDKWSADVEALVSSRVVGGSAGRPVPGRTPSMASIMTKSEKSSRSSASVAGSSPSGHRPSGGGQESSTNLAPLPGVKFCASRNAWIARWAENGQDKWKTFSVNAYGFEDARSLAIECRLDRVRRKYEKLVEQATPEHALRGKGLQLSKVKSSPEKGEALSPPGRGVKTLSDSSALRSDASSRKFPSVRAGESGVEGSVDGSNDSLIDGAPGSLLLMGFDGAVGDFPAYSGKETADEKGLRRKEAPDTLSSFLPTDVPSSRPIRAAKRRFLENLQKGSVGSSVEGDEEEEEVEEEEEAVPKQRKRDLAKGGLNTVDRNQQLSPELSDTAVEACLADSFDGVVDPEFDQLKDVGATAIDLGKNAVCSSIDWSERAKELPQTRGVCFDAKYQQWCYKWKQNSKQCKRSFAVLKYGFEKARELAIECKRIKEGFSSLEEAMQDVYAKPARSPLFVKSTTSTASTETVSSLGACEARSDGDHEDAPSGLSTEQGGKGEGGVDDAAGSTVGGVTFLRMGEGNRKATSTVLSAEEVKPDGIDSTTISPDRSSDICLPSGTASLVEAQFAGSSSSSSASSSTSSSAATAEDGGSASGSSSASCATGEATNTSSGVDGSVTTVAAGEDALAEQLRSELQVHKKALLLILDDLLQNCLGFGRSSGIAVGVAGGGSSDSAPSNAILLELSPGHVERFACTVELHRQRILRAQRVEELGSCVKLFELCIRQRVVPSQVETRTQIVYLHALDALYDILWRRGM